MTLLSPYFTFPPISWWMQVIRSGAVVLDRSEMFQKMSYRNRYRISGANNSNLLTVPLVHGRDQKVPMREVVIHNQGRWQTRHWRTIVSTYRRTPFFDHYELSLKPLYETEYTYLADFDRDSILWVQKQMKSEQIKLIESEANPGEIANILAPGKNLPVPRYHQVFEERLGFLPDLSILDLLFSEGPHTAALLRE